MYLQNMTLCQQLMGILIEIGWTREKSKNLVDSRLAQVSRCMFSCAFFNSFKCCQTSNMFWLYLEMVEGRN